MNLGANNVTTVYDKMVGCTASNTAAAVDQCQALRANNPYNDPLYNAHSWIFEMINVLPVWEMGISKCTKTFHSKRDGEAKSNRSSATHVSSAVVVFTLKPL